MNRTEIFLFDYSTGKPLEMDEIGATLYISFLYTLVFLSPSNPTQRSDEK